MAHEPNSIDSVSLTDAERKAAEPRYKAAIEELKDATAQSPVADPAHIGILESEVNYTRPMADIWPDKANVMRDTDHAVYGKYDVVDFNRNVIDCTSGVQVTGPDVGKITTAFKGEMDDSLLGSLKGMLHQVTGGMDFQKAADLTATDCRAAEQRLGKTDSLSRK